MIKLEWRSITGTSRVESTLAFLSFHWSTLSCKNGIASVFLRITWHPTVVYKPTETDTRPNILPTAAAAVAPAGAARIPLLPLLLLPCPSCCCPWCPCWCCPHSVAPAAAPAAAPCRSCCPCCCTCCPCPCCCSLLLLLPLPLLLPPVSCPYTVHGDVLAPVSDGSRLALLLKRYTIGCHVTVECIRNVHRVLIVPPTSAWGGGKFPVMSHPHPSCSSGRILPWTGSITHPQ